MSLSVFSLTNKWHKNGKCPPIQASGGSPKYSTAPSARNDTNPYAFPVASWLLRSII